MKIGLVNAPLLFEPSLQAVKLQALIYGFVFSEEDLLLFEEETGGALEREFGLPMPRGMDEVEVEEASFLLRVRPQVVPAAFSATAPSGESGVILALEREAELREVVLRYGEPEELPLPVHLVVRVAEPAGSGFAFGPPAFAHPAFPPPGPMYGPVLAGLSVQRSGDRRTVRFPNLRGRAWLIQVAQGNAADELAAVDIQPTIETVKINAVPTNLAVTLGSPDGDVTLWKHPDRLLPSMPPQPIDFTPLAQAMLAAKLAEQGESPSEALTLPLKFNSSSVGGVGISHKKLKARYVARPLPADAAPLRLEGDWVYLTLDVPAAAKPAGSSARWVAQSLGRELNPGSPPPPVETPAGGLVLTSHRWAAAELPIQPRPRAPAGSVVDLVRVQLLLAAMEDSEAVLELRANTAGSPGPSLSPPAVGQLVAGGPCWTAFAFSEPAVVESPPRSLWVVLKLNGGRVLWYSGAHANGAAMLVSEDEGATWAAPESPLAPPGPLLAQAFHRTPDPHPAPRIELWHDASLLAADLRPDLDRSGPREHVNEGAGLPESALQRLSSQPGASRASTTFRLFSAQAVDLRIEDLRLFYSPSLSALGGNG